ncbi:MAG TPA: WYL domain-containing protein [Anaerolineae bacterium]|nr:WYL domain-containing protein [Anaerolineae bacterium]
MRADRLLSLMMLLQTRGKLSARELSEELNVTERTIYRDMEALERAGVPIYAEPGRDGGYGLVDRYRTSLTGLSEGEVRALFMLSVPAPLAELGVTQELKAALLKLTAALPASRRDDEAHVRDRFYLDAVGWEHDGGPTPHLRVIHQAVWQDRRLALKYRPIFSAEVEQRVDPYGLVVKAGEWYLVFAHNGRVRVRRVGELLDVRLTGETFTRPPDFALEAFWKDWCAERAEQQTQFYVRARIAPGAREWLAFYLGSRSRDALAHAGPPDADGWFTLELTFDSLEMARARLLPLGGAVEVLEPDALRFSLADFAAQTLKVYGKPGAT